MWSRFFFHESEQIYGYRRIHANLVDQGCPELVQTWCSRLHAAGQGVVVCQPRKRVRTPGPGILSSSLEMTKRDFTDDKPAQKWVGDITYISTWEGFAYPSGRDGSATRRKSSGIRLLSMCALNLLLMLSRVALRNCPPIAGEMVFHSDRGTQYTSTNYAAVMNQYDIRPSVGRTESCYDNVAAESFNATCKEEVVNRKIYPTGKYASRGCDILDRVAAAINN